MFDFSVSTPPVICYFVADIPIFVHTRDPSEFDNHKVTFLPSTFAIDEHHFTSTLDGSFVFLDDYQPSKHKHNKTAFLSVINYTLRHKKITLFLMVHNLHGTGLFTDIILAPHIFLAYSALGYYVLR